MTLASKTSPPSPAAFEPGGAVSPTMEQRKVWQERAMLTALVGDTLMIALGQVIGYWAKFSSPWAESLGTISEDMTLANYNGQMAVGLCVFIVLLHYKGVYERSFLQRFRSTLLAIAQASLWWLAVFLSVSLALKLEPPLSRLYVLYSWVVVLLLLMLWRTTLHRAAQLPWILPFVRQRMLVVGWSEEAARLCDEISRDGGCFFEVTGCVLPESESAPANVPVPRSVPVAAGLENARDRVRRQEIDVVVLATISLPPQAQLSLISDCERHYVQFKMIPSHFQILLSSLHLESVRGVPMLGVARLPLDRTLNRLTKRAVDICGALAGLGLGMPLFLYCALRVWVESPGSVIYRQTRVGRNGKLFQMLKIRSMRLDAEKDGVGWTSPDDSRRLRCGAFMRRWNIDEIPQFWNVLRGEMSLVGPRPERPEHIVDLQESIPHYNARHNCKPGMSGWAQINGFRGDTDLTERIRHDIYYLENWTVWLDFYIMAMTFVRQKNAY